MFCGDYTIEIPSPKGKGLEQRTVTVDQIVFASASARTLATIFEEMVSLVGQHHPDADTKWQGLQESAEPDALLQAIAASTNETVLGAIDPKQLLDQVKKDVIRYRDAIDKVADIQLATAAEMPVGHNRKVGASLRAILLDDHALQVGSALELFDACLLSIE